MREDRQFVVINSDHVTAIPIVEETVGKINLLGLTESALTAFCIDMGEKKYRAQQILKWIYHRGVTDFELMTDISKATRLKLAEKACIRLPRILVDQPSKDGTHKWLLQLDSGNSIEMVFIPEDDRGTLCISSQIGCALACTFCSTAQQGFNRNLTAAEIIGQVLLAKKILNEYSNEHQLASDRIVTNVVFMGMGEPLLNFNAVVDAIHILLSDTGFGLSKRRVTLSTSGIVPALYRLKEVTDVALAISLHAPTDALRDVLVPINKKYPIAQLLEACRAYLAASPQRSKITWEYVMLAGINDSDAHAHALGKLIRDIPGKVNLIPFNPFPQTHYQRSSKATIERFQKILIEHYEIITITRRTRGDDIDAACGQLAGKVLDKTKRKQQLASAE